MPSRTIHLRRPPVLSVADTPFVPPALTNNPSLAGEIERRWSALCARNPNYFDGRLYHVLGVHRNGHGGATLHVMECAYRYHAVQTPDFDLGQRALGVKGVTMQAAANQYLMGLRSPIVAAYQNLWEFAPAGGVEPGTDPAAIVRNELIEETGYSPATDPIPIAVMFDDVLNCWEIVYRMTVTGSTTDVAPTPHTREYSQLAWHTLDNLPSPLSPIASQIASLLRER